MAHPNITIVTVASKGAALNPTEFDANFENLANAIADVTSGHDHDGTDSKRIPLSVTQGQAYAADSAADDSYIVTLTPVPAAYFNGMVINFKATTANTGAATLNVNSLGAKTIKKYQSEDLVTGDILAGQIITVVYDGTNFQLLNAPCTLRQPVLTNLLTNSQWIAMSGSTLCEVTSGAAPVTDGADAALVNNLLIKGGFDDQASVDTWTESGSVATSDAGGKTGNMMTITNSGAASGMVIKSVTTVIGKLYQFSAYFKKGTAAAGRFYIGTSSGGAEIYNSGSKTDASWTQSVYVFKATATTTYISLITYSATGGETSLWDSVTLYEVTPGYVAADTLAPDGWLKATPLDIWREHSGTNTQNGSFYALKLTSADTNVGLYWPGNYTESSVVKKFTGRTVTIGAWVKTSTASSVCLGIGQTSGLSYSAYHTGSGIYEWLELSVVIASNTTSFYTGIWMALNTTTAYFSQPMLIFGSSIGSGNYQPIPNERIALQKTIQSNRFYNSASYSDSALALLNLEADTNGQLGKGVKAFSFSAFINDSGSAASRCYFMLSDKSSGGQLRQMEIGGIANDVGGRHELLDVIADANGDIYYSIEASGAGTLDIAYGSYIGFVQY